MIKVEQLYNKSGESVFPVIHKSQLKDKADVTMTGNLNELETETKESLVFAINENTKNIAYNLQQIGVRITKKEVEQMISLALSESITEEDIEGLLQVSATIITINDTLLELGTTKANAEDIPTKLSELANDKGFITKLQLTEAEVVQKIQKDIILITEEMLGVATKEEVERIESLIPTKTSEITNDSNFISEESEGYTKLQQDVLGALEAIAKLASKEELELVKNTIPTKVGQLENDKGYITIEEVPSGDTSQLEADIESLKLTKAEQAFVIKEVKRLDDMIEVIEIPEGTDVRPIMKAIEELREGKADKSEIPQKISQLANDLNYITKESLKEHAEIIEILDSITDSVKRIKSLEETTPLIESQVETNKEKIAEVEQNTTKLQADIGTMDVEISTQKGKISKLEEGQDNLSGEVLAHTQQIEGNKDAIELLKTEVTNIPKQTSDLINDSGYITKSNVIGMDLKDNQTIKNIESQKANKKDIPTDIGQLSGTDLLQTKESATQEHKELSAKIGEKPGRDEIPTKFTDLEDDIGLASEAGLDDVRSIATANRIDIETINKTKRVVVTKTDTPVEERKDGNLYLQFGAGKGRVEDHLGNAILLPTNRIVEVDSHPTGEADGAIYVLTSNQKGYILLGGTPKAIALAEDVDLKDKAIMDAISAIQADVASISDRTSENSSSITKVEQDILQTNSKITKAESRLDGHDTIMDGQGRDIIALREKDNTHDSQISSMQTTIKSKANITDVPTALSQLVNDKGFITLGEVPSVDLSQINKDIAVLQESKAEKEHTHTQYAKATDIPTRLSTLENDSGFITLEDIPKVDLSDIQNQLDGKAQKHHMHNTGDVVDSITGKTQTTVNQSVVEEIAGLDESIKQAKEDIANIKIPNVDAIKTDIIALQQEKADKAEVPTKLSQLEQDIDVGKVKSVNGKVGDVKLDSGDIEYSAGWSVYNELGRKASQYLVGELEKNKADKKDVPTKLSQLEQDIELGSEFVIPRTTTEPKDNEITVHEEPKKDFELNIKTISEGVEQDNNTFTFTKSEGYSSLDFEITEGEGLLVVTFADADGYYSYSHRKISGERDDSGWIKDNKTVAVSVVKGDEFRISTGGKMRVKVGEIPVSMEKVLYFNNEAINKETDLTGVFESIGEVRSELGYKANKSDIPNKVSQLENDENYITKADIPEIDMSEVNTQIELLKNNKADREHVHTEYAKTEDVPTKLTDLTDTTIDTPLRFAERIRIKDTRDIEETPLDIMSDRRPSLRFDFKRRTVVGSPDPDISAHRTYAHILTVYGWHDSTGGYPTQISFGKDKFGMRIGTSNETWSEWRKYSDDSIILQKFTQKTEPTDMKVGDEWHKIRD